MGLLLAPLLDHAPPVLKRQALILLFRSTAAAFQRDMPRLVGMSRGQCLKEYARFTTDHAERILRSEEDLSPVQERLYRNAYRLGRAAGRLLGVRDVAGVMQAGGFLYTILEIDLNGGEGGDITVRRCYFSDYYSPDVCRLMSAMDRGLFAGLAGRGELVFVERITEGQPCCRAKFTLCAGAS